MLAVLRGALLDLLATGDVQRVNDAMSRQLRAAAQDDGDVTADPSLAVRRATSADAEDIGRLLHDFNTEFGDPTPGPEWLAQRMGTLLAGGDTVVLLGGAGPDGLAVLRFRQAIWADASEC